MNIKNKQMSREKNMGSIAWTPEIYAEKISPTRIQPFHLAPAFAVRSASAEVGDERLEKAYSAMAEFVTAYGDAYLPIFRRLHDEREQRNANQSLLDLAKKITTLR